MADLPRPVGLQLLATLPAHYERDVKWSLKTPYSTAANRYTLVSPNRITVNIGDLGFALTSAVEIDLSLAANWDSIATDYTVAANRIGKDFYIYGCQSAGSVPKLILSANSSYPAGYTASNSRKVAGYHCVCASVGTISGHTLTGFVAGDILPASIWDLKHRPKEAGPEGLVYAAPLGKWVDIYMASGTGTSTVSVYGGTVSASRNWMDFVDDGYAVNKRLLRDAEFQLIAAGSNEQTNIYGSVNPVTAGKSAPVAQTTGTGLSDLTVDRSGLTGVESQEFQVVIDATGTPDTFKWAQRSLGGAWGSWTTGVAMTGGWQTLANGIKVKFAATTGHTLNNAWNIYIMNGMMDTAARRMISNIGCEGCAGAYYQWLDEQSYRYDPDANYADGGSATQIPVTYAASPGGEQVYLKQKNGVWYLCANLTGAADVFIGTAPNKIPIVYDANANTGIAVYFDNAQGQPAKLRANITGALGSVVVLAPGLGIQEVLITHAASPTGNALYYNDAQTRLETANGSGTMYIDMAVPGFAWKTIGGSKGQLYGQGVYGDVKLLAGLSWSNGTNCGSRCRNASSYRWNVSSLIGARFASEPL